MKKGPRYQQTNLYVDVFPWDQPSTKKAPPPPNTLIQLRDEAVKKAICLVLFFFPMDFTMFFPVLVSIMFFLFPTLFPVFVFATTSSWAKNDPLMWEFLPEKTNTEIYPSPREFPREACRLAPLLGGGGGRSSNENGTLVV